MFHFIKKVIFRILGKGPKSRKPFTPRVPAERQVGTSRVYRYKGVPEQVLKKFPVIFEERVAELPNCLN